MKIAKFTPFFILFALLLLLCRELYSANHEPEIPSFSGESIPAFSLPYLNNPNKTMTQKDLHGHLSFLNIWASWCSACKMEHPMLMKIKNTYGIPIYGIVYKDDAGDAIQYLTRRGNPYTIVGNDESGAAGIDFGIYGTPETYVISPTGEVLYRQVGVITPYVWEKVIYPMVKPYLKKKS